MRERLVGLRHLVRVLSLLYGGAAVARGVEELAGELLGHAALAPTAGGADDPPHRQRGAPVGTHFDRHLIRRPADPPRLDLDRGLHVVDRGFEHLERVRQPHPRDLAERRVRLLGRRRVDADADAALLGTPLHRGRLRLLTHRLTTLMDQLVDGRHDSPSPSRRQNSHFITLRPSDVNDLRPTTYPATATDSSVSPASVTGGVSDSTLSSDFTASPPGVSTSTRV